MFLAQLHPVTCRVDGGSVCRSTGRQYVSVGWASGRLFGRDAAMRSEYQY
jgi:hypothetical protein